LPVNQFGTEAAEHLGLAAEHNSVGTAREAQHHVAMAQVFALLTLANAIEGVGHDIQDVLRTTNAELGSIGIALGEK